LRQRQELKRSGSPFPRMVPAVKKMVSAPADGWPAPPNFKVLRIALFCDHRYFGATSHPSRAFHWSNLSRNTIKILKNIAGSLTTEVYCCHRLVYLSDHLDMPAPYKSDFEVIRRSKVYEDVAKQIERVILKKLKPGDKLPAERELAEMLQVSRSSVRDAIRGLELMGLVEPRQGAGTIVRGLSAESLLNPFANALKHRQELIGELLDFRKMLEPPLAARAATHASADEIAELEEILERQEDKLSRGELAIAEDAEFHYSVALASANSVVLKLLDMVMDLLRDTRERSLQLEGRPQKSLAGHRRILAAIKRHDAEAAKAGMRRHIEDIEEIVLGKL
jgi:GntR family transcriptional repressor for pyruvate dehydrogenase complex